jgi:leucine dehydrogenase
MDTIKAKRLDLRNHPEFDRHEDVIMFVDPVSELKAIIAIHDTTMGPSLGGCRFWNYESEEEAIQDVLRLSRGMTYKSALAGLALGGGKSVLFGNSKDFTDERRERLMTAMGKAVHSLQGRYIIAEDMNTTEEDMQVISRVTPHVGGVGANEGGIGGNPSPVTALGVYKGLKAAAHHKFGSDSLSGKTVSVQGLGAVGMALCDMMHKDGAKLIVTDINPDVLNQAQELYGAQVVGLDDIYDVQADIFAPCARGAIINDDTISRLKVSVIAGAANNQLERSDHGTRLMEKGILYAPDYVINSGGVIFVGAEVLGADSLQSVMDHVEGTYQTSLRVFEEAERRHISTAEAADLLAQEMISLKKHKAA